MAGHDSLSTAADLADALGAGAGIVRLAPNWVPRTFGRPGGRLRLHPDDIRSLGAHRGAIVERWLASCIVADNGPLAPACEGLSWIVGANAQKDRTWLLKDAIAEAGEDFLGGATGVADQGWNVLTKFFDYADGLPFHLHQNDQQAASVGRAGKPEAHYFPAEMNPHPGSIPLAFLGLAPHVTKGDVRQRLERLAIGETRLTELSVAYRLRTGTGWDVPPGVLHGPGSLCTYEPQRASDVYSMFERVAGADVLPETAVWKDVPGEHLGDIDYLLDLIDWEQNVDPGFALKRFMLPVEIGPASQQVEAGYVDRWVVYRSPWFGAKELRVHPGREVIISEPGPHGLIVTAGHGTIGAHDVAAATCVRLGQLTSDELFVTDGAARAGVKYVNRSETDDLVVLRHFASAPVEADPGSGGRG